MFAYASDIWNVFVCHEQNIHDPSRLVTLALVGIGRMITKISQLLVIEHHRLWWNVVIDDSMAPVV